MHKNLRIIGFIISALPLLAYPVVLMASIMSLAGFDATQTEIDIVFFVAMSFLILSIIYPLIYGASLIGAIFIRSEVWKNRLTVLPYISLILTVGLFFLWLALG